MLCPEVLNFKPPPTEFRVESGSFGANSDVPNIRELHFAHLVAVTVPGTLKLPQSLIDILNNDTEYYRVNDFRLSELVEEKFLAAFIKHGNLAALSINTNIDTHNCFCITPNKKLILSLLKETYQSLGLKGTVSHFCKRNKYKYVIKIPLLDIKENVLYQKKLKTALKELNFDVILNWEPPDEKICPSSIAKYLHNLNYNIKCCTINKKSHFVSPKVPEIRFENNDVHDAMEYCEWLGMLALDADFDGSVSSYHSTYEVPEPSSNMGPVKFVQWRGFLISQKIHDFFLALREYKQSEPDIPWVAMYVQGFTDAVVTWGERENHFFTNSDNSYTYFINSNQYLCCTLKSSYKQYLNKN